MRTIVMARKLVPGHRSKSLLPLAAVADLDEYFSDHGIVDWTLSSKDGTKTLKARRSNGEALMSTQYDGEGFSERVTSRCARLGKDQRRREAARLRSRGLTQMAIADKLGVSQRTISSDLKQA